MRHKKSEILRDSSRHFEENKNRSLNFWNLNLYKKTQFFKLDHILDFDLKNKLIYET